MGRRVTNGINDLATKQPILAKEWHPTLNGELTPNDVTEGSNKKVYWKCPKCSYVWQATISNRAQLGRGCPCCSNKVVVKGINDLATTNLEVAGEWYQPLNGDITPYDVTRGCGKKFNWICPKGHIYSATVLHRTNGIGTGCPICNSGRQTSFSEQALYFYIKQIFPTAISSYKNIFSKGMELDIYISDKKIGIEYDGVYWHHKKAANIEREQRKYSICKEHDITLIRVREKKFKDENLQNIGDHILYLAEDKSDISALNAIIDEVIKLVIKITEGHHNESLPDVDVERDQFEILKYLKGAVKNSVKDVAPELMKEWDYEKNGELKPDMIKAGSSLSVYWVCSVCGYGWRTAISHRVNGHTGCPNCLGMVFIPGQNDLKTKNPELLIDWDFEENAKKHIYPDMIQFNSSEKVKWICHECGYKWETSLRARTVTGSGCIQCGYKSGKELKLKRILEKQGSIVDQLLLQEWDYEENSKQGLYPDNLSPGSNKRVHWICSRCGYKWSAPIARRNKGAGCRKCADKANPELKRKKLIENGHALTDELLLKEWDYEHNQKNPDRYSYGSNAKVNWICSKCGYNWCASIASRTRGSGCPSCAGQVVIVGKNDFASKCPELAKEWDYGKNELTPTEISYAAGKKYWWICPKGHGSYIATASHRFAGTGCPICGNLKIAEKAGRAVDQFTLDGNCVKTFKSLKAAAEEYNITNGAISNAIRNGRTSAGFKWKYHE